MIERSNNRRNNNRNNNRKKPGYAGAREQTQCRFCRRGIKYVDYKDIGTLQKLLTNRGKIYSRKRSGKSFKDARFI
jgi:small subunit ribosomal protein S18